MWVCHRKSHTFGVPLVHCTFPSPVWWCTAAAIQTQADTAGKDVWNKNKIKRSVFTQQQQQPKKLVWVQKCWFFWRFLTSSEWLFTWPLAPSQTGLFRIRRAGKSGYCTSSRLLLSPVWKRVLLSAWRTLKRTIFKVWFLQWLWRPNLTTHWRRPYYYHGIIWSEPWLLLEESDPPDFGSENPCAKMTGSNVPQTNGASLEDCHANFFALVSWFTTKPTKIRNVSLWLVLDLDGVICCKLVLISSLHLRLVVWTLSWLLKAKNKQTQELKTKTQEFSP